jgi:hypothetical protein
MIQGLSVRAGAPETPEHEPAAPALATGSFSSPAVWVVDATSPRERKEARMANKIYALPDLPYDQGALEPYISGKIMELHK